MLNRLRLAIVLGAFGLVIGGAFLTTMGNVQAKHTQFQTTGIRTLFNPDGTISGRNPVPGAATLTRTNDGISYSFHTTQLTPGSAYTMWVVVINRPENCVDACNGPDFDLPATRASMLYGGAFIADENGNAHFQGSVERGFPPTGLSVNIPRGTAPGLIRPMTAEIHLGLHDHGPLSEVPGVSTDQLTSFAGGCSNPDYPEEWPGMRGDFFCFTTQDAIFPAP